MQMADHQQDEVASAATTKRDRAAAGRQKANSGRDQRIQDILEDDEVREALRLTRSQRPAGGPASA